MLNFEKTLAIAAKGEMGVDSFKLSDEQRGQLLNYLVDDSLVDRFGAALKPSDIASGSITYLKNVAGKLRNKQGIGLYAGASGAIASGSVITPTKIGQVTIHFDIVREVEPEGLTKADMQRGLPNVAATKIEKFLNQFNNERERDGIREIIKAGVEADAAAVGLAANTDLMDKAVSPVDAYNAVMQIATLGTLHVDPKQAIDLISPDNIETQVIPAVLAKISLAGLVGNRADKTFSGGAYSIVDVAGFSIASNPFIGTVASTGTTTDGTGESASTKGAKPVVTNATTGTNLTPGTTPPALASTVADMKTQIVSAPKFSYKSIMKFTSVRIERLNGTDDIVFRAEGVRGQGFIYTGFVLKWTKA